MKVIIVGGGAAGMLAGIAAAKEKCETVILEKMNNVGKKLRITGKGRCNITNAIDIEEFIKNIPGNGRFLYSSFQNFTNNDIVDILKQEGVNTKVERGNRIFPTTDNAASVVEALYRTLKKLNVKIINNAEVTDLEIEGSKAVGVKYTLNSIEEIMHADKIILATGGKSYPLTGSTGDGQDIAKRYGHSIKEMKPALVPMECYEKEICKKLQGLSLRNVGIEIRDKAKNKKIYDDFGEMLFTHFGMTGPIIISSSSHLIRYKNIDELLKTKQIELSIDLKPALDLEKLDLRIRRDFEKYKNKNFKNSLNELLPQTMIEVVIQLSNINPEKKVNEITKEERKRLGELIKNLKFTISKFRPIDEAIVTAGGINVKEINPKTMESKIIEGLYFAGEIIDVDAYTGGFNLQIAYSTGYTAGMIQNS